MSIYTVHKVVAALKEARKKKGVSQRELSRLTGIPQGHISKIEQGKVDLQVSSLIELFRVLDLELMFVNKMLVPAFEALQSGHGKSKPRPLYALDAEDEDFDE